MKCKAVLWACVMLGVARVESTTIYKKVGDGVALIPPTVPGLTRILWKHGNNRAAELDPDFKPPLDVYGVFKGRTTLDEKTGQLVISGLLASDSGLYTVELNGKLQPTTFDLKVIEPLPAPQITESCNIPKTSCDLTCGGNTTGSEPVSYIWRRGEETLSVTDKTLTVTQTDDQIKPYRCQMENPVSQEDSPAHKNPFYPKPLPEPQITESCNIPKSSCDLTCEGNTTGSEPVSYIWRRGEETLSVTDKTLTITQTDDQIKPYRCQMKNPVSQEDSPAHKNPFYPKDVPKPRITESCNAPKTSCDLTCGGGDTTGSEPVTYSWMKSGDDGSLSAKTTLTVTESDYQFETYRCRMKNPVSQEDSPPHKNPFYKKPVPQPKITEICDNPKTSCSLTCDGDTTGSEPVSYIWRRGEETLSVTDKTLTITNSDDQIDQTYTCLMENIVGRKTSPTHKNPFHHSIPDNLKAGVSVLVACFFIVILVIVLHKYKSGVWFFQKDSMPWQADFWTKQGDGRVNPAEETTNEKLVSKSSDHKITVPDEANGTSQQAEAASTPLQQKSQAGKTEENTQF